MGLTSLDYVSGEKELIVLTFYRYLQVSISIGPSKDQNDVLEI
jgi:hypothetical protein